MMTPIFSEARRHDEDNQTNERSDASALDFFGDFDQNEAIEAAFESGAMRMDRICFLRGQGEVPGHNGGHSERRHVERLEHGSDSDPLFLTISPRG